MSEALKKAREALQLMYGCKMTLRDRAVVDAALAAIDAEAKPAVRMLTDGEIADALSGYGMMAKQIQRKFAEVNGLTIGEQG